MAPPSILPSHRKRNTHTSECAVMHEMNNITTKMYVYMCIVYSMILCVFRMEEYGSCGDAHRKVTTTYIDNINTIYMNKII